MDIFTIEFDDIENKLNNNVLNKYNICELLALLVFKHGKFLENINDYYEVDNKDKLLNNMNKILK